MLNRAYSLFQIKRADEETRTITGIASTPSADRLGDVVEPEGAQFNLPLALLWQHDSHQPIGHVTHAKTNKDGIEIKAKIARMAEPGRLKDRLDEAWQSIKTGLVAGLSIGFTPIESSRLKDGGIHFLKWSWLELSAVTIPANSEATIITIRSLDTAQRAASGQQTPSNVVSNLPGASGLLKPTQPMEGRKMKTIAEQITALENKRAASFARMEQVMEKSLDEGRTSDASEQEEFDTLSAEVDALDKDLTRLRKLENTKAVSAKPIVSAVTANEGSLARGGNSPVYAMPTKKVEPQQWMWNSLVCAIKGFHTHQSPYQILKEEFGDDEPTRAVMNALITRSATAPADTVTSGWASQLVATSIQGYFGALIPNAVYPSLSAKGAKFTFGTNGVVTMPSRSSTPTIAGSFVAQGAPIPVRQGAFTSVSFTPKKMGVISTFTREIAEHSTPNIETLIREIIVEDTSVAIDTVLLDATAATTTRPAGLRAGVSATTATAGGTITALIGDIRALTTALITGTNGNIRNPVWIMNPGDVLAAQLLPAVAGGGQFPFKDELAAGRLQGYPVIQSATVPADMMFLLDAADFVSVTGDTPRFDVSNQATLHMEDTTPLAIASVGSPNTVAAPVRSLYHFFVQLIRFCPKTKYYFHRSANPSASSRWRSRCS